MHKLGTGQDRILCHSFLPVDSGQGGGEQTKLLNKHDIVVNHGQDSNIQHVCGENEDKLRGLNVINTPSSMRTKYAGTYQFEKNLSRMAKYEGETERNCSQKHEKLQGVSMIEDSYTEHVSQFRGNGAGVLYTCDKSPSFLIHSLDSH